MKITGPSLPSIGWDYEVGSGVEDGIFPFLYYFSFPLIPLSFLFAISLVYWLQNEWRRERQRRGKAW